LDFLIPITAIFFVIGVPVVSLATHFVLRPLVRDITLAIHGKKEAAESDLIGRIARLEEVVLEQNKQLDQLVDAEAFRRRLESGQTKEESVV